MRTCKDTKGNEWIGTGDGMAWMCGTHRVVLYGGFGAPFGVRVLKAGRMVGDVPFDPPVHHETEAVKRLRAIVTGL